MIEDKRLFLKTHRHPSELRRNYYYTISKVEIEFIQLGDVCTFIVYTTYTIENNCSYLHKLTLYLTERFYLSLTDLPS